LGEEDNSHLRVGLHQLGRGFTYGDFKEQVSHLLVCPSSSTPGVDMGMKPALAVASDADEYARGFYLW
ncbi:hypothetical protein A2U01_0043454, partial [Trifolium medium]|nr:hypothetical protein [Trifolium medium]